MDAYVAVHTLPETSDLTEVRSLLLRAAPMAYARWDAAQRAHAATEPEQLNPVPRAGFWQGVDEATRMELLERLHGVDCPVLVVTGDRDAVTGMRAGEAVAASFRSARLQPLHEVGHYPWVDEPEMFRPLVEEFLRGGYVNGVCRSHGSGAGTIEAAAGRLYGRRRPAFPGGTWPCARVVQGLACKASYAGSIPATASEVGVLFGDRPDDRPYEDERDDRHDVRKLRLVPGGQQTPGARRWQRWARSSAEGSRRPAARWRYR
ncbi:hypothetical protein GCM10020000_50450 [Streptomyces olivoverticillatus]